MTKIAIEEFHKNKNKRDENKSLLSRSPEARNDRNEVREEAREEAEGISQTQNVVRLQPETLEIRPSMKEVDEIFVGQDKTQTPPVNRRLKLELEISSDKSRNHHNIDNQTPIKVQIDSPVLDESKKIEEFKRRMPMRVGTGGSNFQSSPQIRSLKSGVHESKPNLTEYSFHEA